MTSDPTYHEVRDPGRPGSFRIILRYSLLQLPATIMVALTVLLVDHYWIKLPQWFIWAFIGAWLLKDAALYPVFWRAYAPADKDQRLSMIGRSGRAIEAIDPEGYVRVQGELWKATAASGHQTIQKGQTVLVSGIQGLLLTVRLPETRPRGQK